MTTPSWHLLSPTTAYGVVTFAMQAVHNVFLLFYVAHFRSSPYLTDWGFYFGQAAYLVWNSVNDPLFGHSNDRSTNAGGWFWSTSPSSSSSSGSPRDGPGWGKRSGALRRGSPLLALAFVSLWIDPGAVSAGPVGAAVHFTLAICAYDGAFSYVYVAHQAALADVFSTASERVRAARTAAMGSLVAAVPVLFAYYALHRGGEEGGVEDGADDGVARWPFVAFCIALGALSAIMMWFGAVSLGSREVSLGGGATAAAAEKSGTASVAAGATGRKGGDDADAPSFINVLTRLLARRSFAVFTLVSALQTLACSLATNTFPLLIAALCARGIGVAASSVALAATFALPHAVTIALAPVVTRRGAPAVIGSLLSARASVGAVLLVAGAAAVPAAVTAAGDLGVAPAWWDEVGPRGAWLVCLALLALRLLTEAVCRLSSLIITDLVDEDALAVGASGSAQDLESAAGAVNGAQALLTRPFQTAAPVAAWAYLGAIGVPRGAEVAGKVSLSQGRSMYLASVGASCAIAIAQVAVWKSYELRGEKLKTLREDLKGRAGLLNSAV